MPGLEHRRTLATQGVDQFERRLHQALAEEAARPPSLSQRVEEWLDRLTLATAMPYCLSAGASIGGITRFTVFPFYRPIPNLT